jgi:hypothetical protein
LELSLDDIEHRILRAVFRDPGVHYSVNCASIGCPNLQNEAFTGLNSQLDAGARAFVNNPRESAASGSCQRVVVSSIYNWFKADFGGTDEGVLTHLRKYAMPDLAVKLKTATSISDYQYDWRLNDVRR